MAEIALTNNQAVVKTPKFNRPLGFRSQTTASIRLFLMLAMSFGRHTNLIAQYSIAGLCRFQNHPLGYEAQQNLRPI